MQRHQRLKHSRFKQKGTSSTQLGGQRSPSEAQAQARKRPAAVMTGPGQAQSWWAAVAPAASWPALAPSRGRCCRAAPQRALPVVCTDSVRQAVASQPLPRFAMECSAELCASAKLVLTGAHGWVPGTVSKHRPLFCPEAEAQGAHLELSDLLLGLLAHAALRLLGALLLSQLALERLNLLRMPSSAFLRVPCHRLRGNATVHPSRNCAGKCGTAGELRSSPLLQ